MNDKQKREQKIERFVIDNITELNNIQEAEIEFHHHFIQVHERMLEMTKDMDVMQINENYINCIEMGCEKIKECKSYPLNFNYNKNYLQRNALLFPNNEHLKDDFYELTGSIRIEVNLNVLKTLIENRFASKDDTHNHGYSIGWFINFVENVFKDGKDEIIFLGYAINHKRDDYRISIDGIKYIGDCTNFYKGVKYIREKFFSNANFIYVGKDGFIFWYD
jgi:hypothetical protein